MIADSSDSASFSDFLAEFEGDAIHNDGGTIYGLWPDLTLAYFNLGWKRFAESNRGEPQISSEWGMNRCVLDAIAEPLRPFFESNYALCLREGRPWEHTYECSSAVMFRKFHMMTFPLPNAVGLLVINSLRHEFAHTRAACLPLEELYRSEDGIATQCCHCRRMRRAGPDQVWDWVPTWVRAPLSNLSHGLCAPCFAYHYSPNKGIDEPFAQPFNTAEEGFNGVPA